MGNCIRAQMPAVVSVEDDGFWEAMEQESSGHHGEQQEDDEYSKLFLAETTVGAGSSEIKIRISKRQLEELLRRRADDDRGSKDQLRLLVADLVISAKSGKLHEQEGRHWRPRLHSIPEQPE